jgi:hypothetical protein
MVSLMRLRIKRFLKKNVKSKIVSQHNQKVQTNTFYKGKTSSSKLIDPQELKSHFKSHFVQAKGYVPTITFPWIVILRRVATRMLLGFLRSRLRFFKFNSPKMILIVQNLVGEKSKK